MTDINQSDWNEVDASNTSASPNGWPSGTMLPSAVEPSARAMRGATKRWYNRINATATSAGTNTVTLTYTVAPAAYVTGDFYLFKAGGTNTGATTLNVNALGAKTVQWAGLALSANDIVSGFYYGVVYDGTNFQIVFSSAVRTPATFSAVPANPTGTASTTNTMAGLGSTCKITPHCSGAVVFHFEFVGTNSGAGGNDYQMYYGTGSAPANGAAVTGAALGTDTASIPGGTGGQPYSFTNVVTGLIPGTQYWFDVSQAAVGSGTAAMQRINAVAFELN